MVKKSELYPLKFTPILKEKVWGGDKLANLFGKKAQTNTGESWELSGVEGNESEVASGSLIGRTLSSLIEEYKEQLVGNEVYEQFSNTFPLLFKFIDASQDLSVQLHPNDLLAKERHDSFGKTEMWYIMQAENDARLILGFKEDTNQKEYLKYLSENKLTEILHSEYVKEGDSFFIETGTVHAIGAGIVLAEIQQTSDITYRIYDWDRPDIDGTYRELHTDLALEAISYKRSKAKLNTDEVEDGVNLLCNTPYFETNKLVLTRDIQRNYTVMDSFVVYMCVEGEFEIESNQEPLKVSKGETILIPAEINEVSIHTSEATILEVYIP